MGVKTLPVTGGCLCGAVRYQLTEPPEGGACCHCRMCQKSCGNPYFASAYISVKSFQFTKGEPKYYRSSTYVERGFCAACGTPLIFRDGTDLHAIYIGTLDHPEEWPPTINHLGMESRIPWDTIHDDLPCWNTEDDPEVIEAKAIYEGQSQD